MTEEFTPITVSCGKPFDMECENADPLVCLECIFAVWEDQIDDESKSEEEEKNDE